MKNTLHDLKQDVKKMKSVKIRRKQQMLEEANMKNIWEFTHVLEVINAQIRGLQITYIARQIMVRLDLDDKETKICKRIIER